MVVSVANDRLFVVLDKLVEEKTLPSGFKIQLPNVHSERSRLGTVKLVGPEVKDYKVGDRVVMSWYSGVRVHLIDEDMFGESVDEERFRVVIEDEILCKVLEE